MTAFTPVGLHYQTPISDRGGVAITERDATARRITCDEQTRGCVLRCEADSQCLTRSFLRDFGGVLLLVLQNLTVIDAVKDTDSPLSSH